MIFGILGIALSPVLCYYICAFERWNFGFVSPLHTGLYCYDFGRSSGSQPSDIPLMASAIESLSARKTATSNRS